MYRRKDKQLVGIIRIHELGLLAMLSLTVPVSGFNKLKSVCEHRVGSENDGQVLVVDGELPEGDDDSTRLLVQSLAVPVRVQLVEAVFDVVVLTHPDHVLRRYTSELIHSTVA